MGKKSRRKQSAGGDPTAAGGGCKGTPMPSDDVEPTPKPAPAATRTPTQSSVPSDEEIKNSLSVKELKELIARAGMSSTGCTDKAALRARALDAAFKLQPMHPNVLQYFREMAAGKGASGPPASTASKSKAGAAASAGAGWDHPDVKEMMEHMRALPRVPAHLRARAADAKATETPPAATSCTSGAERASSPPAAVSAPRRAPTACPTTQIGPKQASRTAPPAVAITSGDEQIRAQYSY